MFVWKQTVQKKDRWSLFLNAYNFTLVNKPSSSICKLMDWVDYLANISHLKMKILTVSMKSYTWNLVKMIYFHLTQLQKKLQKTQFFQNRYIWCRVHWFIQCIIVKFICKNIEHLHKVCTDVIYTFFFQILYFPAMWVLLYTLNICRLDAVPQPIHQTTWLDVIHLWIPQLGFSTCTYRYLFFSSCAGKNQHVATAKWSWIIRY